MINFSPNAQYEFSNFKVLKCKTAANSTTPVTGSNSGNSTTAANKENGATFLFSSVLLIAALLQVLIL